jgi:hypothetical protein
MTSTELRDRNLTIWHNSRVAASTRRTHYRDFYNNVTKDLVGLFHVTRPVDDDGTVETLVTQFKHPREHDLGLTSKLFRAQPNRFSIDGEGSMFSQPGYVVPSERRWNGWANPYFERKEVQAIIDEVTESDKEFGETSYEFEWFHDDLIIKDHNSLSVEVCCFVNLLVPSKTLNHEWNNKVVTVMQLFSQNWCWSEEDE